MTYADNVMAHYNGAGSELRTRLRAVLAEAEKAQAAKPRTKPKPTRPAGKLDPALKRGALASEREEFARTDRAFAASTVASADTILASEARRIAQVEGLTLDEAMDAVFARYPLTRQRYAEGR